jgi:hypothetical protein
MEVFRVDRVLWGSLVADVPLHFLQEIKQKQIKQLCMHMEVEYYKKDKLCLGQKLTTTIRNLLDYDRCNDAWIGVPSNIEWICKKPGVIHKPLCHKLVMLAQLFYITS